jgi:hypothetical protein
MRISSRARAEFTGVVRGHLCSVQIKVFINGSFLTTEIVVGLDPAACCRELRQRQG